MSDAIVESTVVAKDGIRKKTEVMLLIGRYIVARQDPAGEPRLFMWRETNNDVRSKDWTRDGPLVHYDLKLYIRPLILWLAQEYEITAIKVNANIRRLVAHGAEPICDRRRNAPFYRSCRPTSHNPTMGLITFPRNCRLDHPSLAESLDCRGREQKSRIQNFTKSVDQARDFGILSEDRKDGLYHMLVPEAVTIVQRGLPLFRKTLEATKDVNGALAAPEHPPDA